MAVVFRKSAPYDLLWRSRAAPCLVWGDVVKTRIVLVLICVVLVAAAGGQPATAAFAGSNGPLLMSSSFLALNGEQTPHAFLAFDAQFSPDGTKIARPYNLADGTATVRVRSSNGVEVNVGDFAGWYVRDVAWSPDGLHLAVLIDSDTDDCDARIYRMPLDGSSPRQLLLAPEGCTLVSSPDWSPNGNLIAYVYGSSDIFTVPAAGGTPTNLTGQCTYPPEDMWGDCSASDPVYEYSRIDWSPSGHALVADVIEDHGVEGVGYVGIYVPGDEAPTVLAMDVPGGSINGGRPIWSPDGTKVAYMHEADEADPGTYVIAATGGTGQRISASGGAKDWQPCPGGKCAVFAAGEPTYDCTIKGTAGNDTLNGTQGVDVICGFGGNDRLVGDAGADVLLGGEGADTLRAGPGNDTLRGGPGSDMLRGQEGNDAVRGDAGYDFLGGGPGDDTIDGGTDVDTVIHLGAVGPVTASLAIGKATGEGTDTLTGIENMHGTDYADRLIGSAGQNLIWGRAGEDEISGGDSPDVVLGGDGPDVLSGGSGPDLVVGAAGADKLRGGAGADLLRGETADEAAGGDGVDICYVGGAPTAGCEFPADTSAMSSSTSSTEPSRVAAATAEIRQWYLGNGDYLYVYNVAATAALDTRKLPNAGKWESQVCRALRYTPAKGACSAAGKVTAIQKWQVQWFVNRAKANTACAAVVFDYGRHGINQFVKRWKVRPAQDYRYRLDVAWITPGRVTQVKVSDPKEVKGAYYNVSC